MLLHTCLNILGTQDAESGDGPSVIQCFRCSIVSTVQWFACCRVRSTLIIPHTVTAIDPRLKRNQINFNHVIHFLGPNGISGTGDLPNTYIS